MRQAEAVNEAIPDELCKQLLAFKPTPYESKIPLSRQLEELADLALQVTAAAEAHESRHRSIFENAFLTQTIFCFAFKTQDPDTCDIEPAHPFVSQS